MTNNCSSNCNCSSNKNKPCADSCNPNTTTTVYYQPFSDPNECCCRNSLIKAFQAIQQAVVSTGIPGFGVELLITTITGTTYTVFVASGIATPLVVTCEAIVYGNLAINLDDIAKIQILSGLTGNPTFINNLLTLLRNITSCNRPYNCPIAVTVDEEDEGSSLMRGCCNNCNRPYNQCGCGNNGFYCGTRPPTNQCPPTPTPPYSVSNTGLQDFINRNAGNLSSINFIGSQEVIENITVIDTIADTTVVSSASISTTFNPAITSATFVPGANVSIVNTLNTGLVPLVDSVTYSTIPISGVVESITSDSTTVITGFPNINAETVVTGFPNINAETVVTDFPTPTSVAVVTGYTPATTNALGGVGLTDVDVVTIGSVATPLISNPTVFLTGAGSALYISIPAGYLGQYDVGGSIGIIPIPTAATLVPLFISISATDGEPVAITNYNVATIATPTTLISTTGTVAVVDVITDLGDPASVNALTDLGIPTTVAALTTLGAPDTVAALTTLGTPTFVTALTTITAVSIVGLGQLVTNVTVSVDDYEVVENVETGLIPSGGTLSLLSGTFVSNVTLSTATAQALTGVGLDTISITSPTSESIPGTVQAVGSGLVVVQDSIGNITLYSVCKIDSVTSLN